MSLNFFTEGAADTTEQYTTLPGQTMLFYGLIFSVIL